ncbi:uncharacterized protein BP5553_01316 [Venustampulla echinocandica]|uniref:Uncharacterized protein n=1 Tax=Venustampulla echinocandica TaxID=2656787 RepID=A0A370U0N8_9HELO|nr:uncharacterized protein BP5553_01316 [Venustampulla echinocandica]RDL41337.1 hypothetical protein BP5553_01316 [Venustampulla echinocandica]
MLGFNIPATVASCALRNQTVKCPFSLYNVTVLGEAHRLAPNNDITGSTIFKAFIGSACASLIVSLCLIIDKVVLHFYDKHSDEESRLHHRFYLQALNSVTTLIHTISDQAFVACLALLFTLSQQACTISAYHYNLVCLMLVMGIVTHLNTLVSVPDFFTKGKIVATYRVILIIIQMALTGVALSARHHTSFPLDPSGLAALPAACFANANAGDGLGFAGIIDVGANVTAGIGSNSTSNSTSTTGTESATKGMGIYITLMVFGFFALLILIGDWIEEAFANRKHKFRWFSIFISVASLIASIVIVFYALAQYNALVNGMEIPKWYKTTIEDKWTFSQYMPVILLASASIPLFKALTDSLLGLSGRRFEVGVNKLVKGAGAVKYSAQTAGYQLPGY